MKKITILLLLIAPAFFISSCKKEGAPETRTINVEIKANESYSSSISARDADVMKITTQAQHALVSKVSLDPATGNNVFQYTPALDFIGTDEVQITNTEGKGNGKHHCGGNDDKSTIYIYKIIVKGETTG